MTVAMPQSVRRIGLPQNNSKKRDQMPMISVIVPIFKVEAYLDRCVQSVLKQTYSDFELILVDDGSPDRCGLMCDEWMTKDSRIRVLHKENGGLSDARNAGVSIARGEWITFVDSDDYIHPQMLESLYRAITQCGVKIAVCGYVRTRGEPLQTEQVLQATLWTPEQLYTQRCINATVAWGKLYHQTEVRAYPVGKLHEDEFITYQVLFAQEKIAVIDGALYAYFTNDAGIMNQKWKPGRLDILEAIEQQISFFTTMGYRQIAYQRASEYVANICSQLQYISQMQDCLEQKKYARFCRDKLRNGIRKYQRWGYINLLDHYEAYKMAWPWKIGQFAIIVSLWRLGGSLNRTISQKRTTGKND
jgi:glycosyltransferase involved in cell wall biosynthesis